LETQKEISYNIKEPTNSKPGFKTEQRKKVFPGSMLFSSDIEKLKN
jgi:hypothetical protein